MITRCILLASIAVGCSSSSILAAMNIVLAFTGNGLSPSQVAAFQEAELFWERVLIGYQPGILLTGPTIYASGSIIDGVGGIVGQAAPLNTELQSGFQLTTEGIMSFDSDDLAFLESRSLLDEVIAHEMAHVLGYGFFWNQHHLYANGTGQYLGQRGLAEYRAEFVGQGLAGFVPVELAGGGGTADFHWDEVNQGAGPTGRVTRDGRDMRDELMTGWLNSQLPQFVSRTTLGQFEDIGFLSSLSPIPEPSAFWLSLVATLSLWLSSWRRFMRRKQNASRTFPGRSLGTRLRIQQTAA